MFAFCDNKIHINSQKFSNISAAFIDWSLEYLHIQKGVLASACARWAMSAVRVRNTSQQKQQQQQNSSIFLLRKFKLKGFLKII